jgi:DNA-binding response OmpR family regulator
MPEVVKKPVPVETPVLVKKVVPVKKVVKPVVAPATAPVAAPVKAAGKTIMVVDDEPDIRSSVKIILEKNGYAVVEASSADDALKKLVKVKPDLILLDIMMPGTPVSEAVPKMGAVKIAYLSVVRTSEAEKEDLMKSKNIVDFIQKPFDINELLARVKKLVG